MKLALTSGTIVLLDMENMRDKEDRVSFVDRLGQWVADNVYGTIDTVFIRQGIHVDEKTVLDNGTVGDTYYEQWMWIFSDPKEATLFKLTFG